MSIWRSYPTIGTAPYDPWDDDDSLGNVLTYARGFSNHHPDLQATHELPAYLAVADVAPWCVPGHDQDGDGYRCTGCSEQHDFDAGEWLRLDVGAPKALNFWVKDDDGNASVDVDPHMSFVLDVEAVRSLREQLDQWLERATVKALQGPRGAQKAASDGCGGSEGTPMGSRETGDGL